MAMPCSLVVAAFAQLMQRVDRWPDLHFEAGLAWQHARSGYGGIAPALASLPPGFSQVALVNDASQLWCEKHPAAKCRTECTVLADAGPDSQCVNISYPDTEQNRSGGTHDLHYLIPPLFEASRQGARILVGPYTSSMANFLAPIAVALGVALIAPTVTSAELTEASELRQKRPTPSSQQPSLVRSGLRAYRSSAPPPLESSKAVRESRSPIPGPLTMLPSAHRRPTASRASAASRHLTRSPRTRWCRPSPLSAGGAWALPTPTTASAARSPLRCARPRRH